MRKGTGQVCARKIGGRSLRQPDLFARPIPPRARQMADAPGVNTLRLKLWLALLLALATITGMGISANRAVNFVRAHYALADAAAQSLGALQRLTVLGYSLHQERNSDPVAFARDRQMYIEGVRSHVRNADRYLNEEIRVLSEAPMPPDRRTGTIQAELLQREQLQKIGASLENSLLSTESETVWEDLALDAIKIEEREAKVAQRGLMDAFQKVVDSLAIIATLFGIGSFCAVVWVQRQVIRPLDNLLDSTRAIAGGDYEHRVPLQGTNELRTIGSSFNMMADQVDAATKTMRQTNEELERAVARRTQELAASNRSLERANRLRQQFLADASHELRTPLTIMRSEAEITLRDGSATSEDLRAGLDRIVRLSALMGETIEDMLQIARAEEPMLTTCIVPIDAVAAIKQCIEDFRRLIEADGGAINAVDAPPSLIVDADEGRLKQVIRIIFDNAVCYSSDPPLIEVKILHEAGDAIITISDHGIGIAVEDIPHLFQRFRRGSRKSGSGQGLGLSIARSIMEAMGGTIGISSKLDEGTTVSIRLPLASNAAKPDGYRV